VLVVGNKRKQFGTVTKVVGDDLFVVRGSSTVPELTTTKASINSEEPLNVVRVEKPGTFTVTKAR
jgi:hypothetical protein